MIVIAESPKDSKLARQREKLIELAFESLNAKELQFSLST